MTGAIVHASAGNLSEKLAGAIMEGAYRTYLRFVNREGFADLIERVAPIGQSELLRSPAEEIMHENDMSGFERHRRSEFYRKSISMGAQASASYS